MTRSTVRNSRLLAASCAVMWLASTGCTQATWRHSGEARVASKPSSNKSAGLTIAPADALNFAPQQTFQKVSLQQTAAVTPEDRVVKYSARYTIAVNDIEISIQSSIRIAEEVSGYMQRRTNDLVELRIPAKTFRPTLAQLESLGAVSDRDIGSEDITEQWVDLAARIRAAETVRDRLTRLLDSAKTVEETLQVEKELGRINTELEQMYALRQMLDNQVSYSTVTVRFVRVARSMEDLGPAPNLPFPWLNQLDLGRLMDNEKLSLVKVYSGSYISG